MSDKLLETVSNYYTGKVKEHGASARGVDWNSKESQYLRFNKLCEVLVDSENFSVLDYGCGTGALVSFLEENKKKIEYYGFDISEEMIKLAKIEHQQAGVQFLTSLNSVKTDYVLGSGIFNVRFNFKDEDWIEYIHKTLDDFNKISQKGFSFNLLSTYSDVEKRRDDLFYADPLYYFDLCKKKYSRFVTLEHDYPLYEFTIIVRKNI